jgi:hypothetical protein
LQYDGYVSTLSVAGEYLAAQAAGGGAAQPTYLCDAMYKPQHIQFEMRISNMFSDDQYRYRYNMRSRSHAVLL